jgi:hypothetical protein
LALGNAIGLTYRNSGAFLNFPVPITQGHNYFFESTKQMMADICHIGHSNLLKIFEQTKNATIKEIKKVLKDDFFLTFKITVDLEVSNAKIIYVEKFYLLIVIIL